MKSKSQKCCEQKLKISIHQQKRGRFKIMIIKIKQMKYFTTIKGKTDDRHKTGNGRLFIHL